MIMNKNMLEEYKELLIRIKMLEEENSKLKDENFAKDKIIRKLVDENNKDSLTNILNRRGIRTKINSIGEIPYSLIMCDIDDFKNINDTYGHVVGDEVIKMVSSIIQKSIREEDYVARIGGDEMIMLLSGCNEITAQNKCELISEKISKNNDFKFPITLSFGIAYRNLNMTYDETKELADQALYVSKRNGKNIATVYKKNNRRVL